MLTKTVKIGKSGNGLWFRIPAEIVRARNIKPGDEVEFAQIGEN